MSKKKKATNPKRDEDFANLLEPENPKEETITLDRPIYHNGRQYTVKIPKEIILHVGFTEGDMFRYKLVNSPNKQKPVIEIEYVRQDGKGIK